MWCHATLSRFGLRRQLLAGFQVFPSNPLRQIVPLDDRILDQPRATLHDFLLDFLGLVGFLMVAKGHRLRELMGERTAAGVGVRRLLTFGLSVSACTVL
jgi:hypothetical protein